MPMIREVIVTTVDRSGQAHIAPLGLIEDGDGWIIAPFLPSVTHDNLWKPPLPSPIIPMTPAFSRGSSPAGVTGLSCPWRTMFRAASCASALAHAELKVAHLKPMPERPRFHCKVVHQEQHAPFEGFNRAANAVLECAILLTRLHMLPRDKIDQEIAYLAIAIEKTAGPREARGLVVAHAKARSVLRRKLSTEASRATADAGAQSQALCARFRKGFDKISRKR